jgi:hypothetical protein
LEKIMYAAELQSPVSSFEFQNLNAEDAKQREGMQIYGPLERPRDDQNKLGASTWLTPMLNLTSEAFPPSPLARMGHPMAPVPGSLTPAKHLNFKFLPQLQIPRPLERPRDDQNALGASTWLTPMLNLTSEAFPPSPPARMGHPMAWLRVAPASTLVLMVRGRAGRQGRGGMLPDISAAAEKNQPRVLEVAHWQLVLPMLRKRRGEAGEAFALWRAFGLGFNVGVLWGDAAQFDFILEWCGRMSRIQVKAAFVPSRDRCNRYVFRTTSRGDAQVTYSKRDTDFMVCVIPPLGLSYIIPIEEIGPGQKQLYVYPGDAEGKPRRRYNGRSYEEFRECWDLLK